MPDHTADPSLPPRRGTDQLLTVADVAHRLQVRPKQVRAWLRGGRLRGIKLGKSWRVTWAALDAFLGSW